MLIMAFPLFLWNAWCTASTSLPVQRCHRLASTESWSREAEVADPLSKTSHHNNKPLKSSLDTYVNQMSSLVSEFLINPVLRQARRFSRPNVEIERVDSLIDQDVSHDSPENPHYATTSHEVMSTNGRGDVLMQDGERLLGDSSISGALIVSSPIDEDVRLEAEGGSRHYNNDENSHTRTSAAPTHSISLRLAAIRSESQQVDDDTTENPSFGITSRMQTGSPMEGSGSRTSQSTTISRDPSIGETSNATAVLDTRQRTRSLPEDDGMGVLRRRIILIQGSEMSGDDKARLMHQLLTEGYRGSQAHQNSKPIPIPPLPNSLISQDMPSTSPGSLNSLSFWPNTNTPDSSLPNPENQFHLSPDDLRPTYAPVEPREPGESREDDEEEQTEPQPVLGCRHYKRNVKLQCSTCNRWYTCRFCHDEAEDHVLNRKETKNMLCMLCGCAQRAGDVCVDCNVSAAWYYCTVCKLWDDDANKSIYHCNDCGICRVGRGLGKDFIHCKVSCRAQSTPFEVI
jgi:uncharacterized CHY-type Zn-finger protein